MNADPDLHPARPDQAGPDRAGVIFYSRPNYRIAARQQPRNKNPFQHKQAYVQVRPCVHYMSCLSWQWRMRRLSCSHIMQCIVSCATCVLSLPRVPCGLCFLRRMCEIRKFGNAKNINCRFRKRADAYASNPKRVEHLHLAGLPTNSCACKGNLPF